MFRKPSSHATDPWRGAALPGLVLLASLIAAPAQAGPVAKSHAAISVHAGPASDYPQVQYLPANTRLQVQGCLPGFAWCDVSTGRYRGWVRAEVLGIAVDGHYQPVHVIGPVIGVPVIQFSIGPYWHAHYRNQPWFDDPRFAAEINTYRVQSRVGNTVIEYERSWHAEPRYRPYPPPAVHYEPPPVYVVPAPGYHPPQPMYGPSHYEPPIFIPPSQRLPGSRPYHAPAYPPPGTIHQPPAFRPAPVPHPVDPGHLPGHQPDGRRIPPGAIIQNSPAPSGGTRILK